MDLEWNNSYHVGIETIDSEHKLLLSLIEKYFTSESGDEEDYAYNGLIRYIRDHFANEEETIRKHNVTNDEEHKQSHTQLFNRITELHTGVILGSYIKEDFLDFFMDWFKSHITQLDTHFRNEDHSRK